MITVEEAKKIIESNTVTTTSTEVVKLTQALGRVLAEDVLADRSFPPFDRVAMDGVAIRYSDYESGSRYFKIVGESKAGSPQISLEDDGCIEVMTGSVLPHNTDTVIRYEDVSIENDVAYIESIAKPYGNVHIAGSDLDKDDKVILKDTLINALHINILATVGCERVMVNKNPSIAIISTGDELVEVHEKPMPHQIRRSNVHMISSSLRSYGIPVTAYHLMDERSEIKQRLSEIIDQHDAIVLIGGVSKGKYDFIPNTLQDIGAEVLFHKVAQRPGKPLLFAKKDHKMIFAFPGNPMSSHLCLHNYLIPWWMDTMKLEQKTIHVRLANDIHFTPSLTYYVPVYLMNTSNGILQVRTINTNGSGDMVSPANADGYVELTSEKNDFKAGDIVRFISTKSNIL